MASANPDLASGAAPEPGPSRSPGWSDAPDLRRTSPVYVGAFLGPFGGNVVQVLFPILQQRWGLDVQQLALSLTAYMVPFAVGQFFTGAIADRYGRRPVLVASSAFFALASVLCAAAPSYGVFLLARAGQGLANAGTTPILMAMLGDAVPPARLGRALGLFGAANTAGLFLAPLVSGGLAMWNWRAVYILLALTATALTVLYVVWRTPRPTAPALAPGRPAAPAGWREVLTPQLGLLCAGAMLGYFSLNGVGFLVVLFSTAAYGLDSARSGLLLSTLGLANMLAAGPAGALVDRVGSRMVGAAGAVAAALVLAALPWSPVPAVMGSLLLVGGAGVAALWAGLTTLAVKAVPTRRATASSLFNAWKFVGYAIAPLVYAPLYAARGAPFTFAAAAGLTLLIIPLLIAATGGAGNPVPAPNRSLLVASPATERHG